MSSKKLRNLSNTRTEDDLLVSMPHGTQGGHGIPKVISRNPVHLGNNGNNFRSVEPKARKAEIFIYNELDRKQSYATKARSPSTRIHTMSNDYSNSMINRVTDLERTEDY